MCNTRYKEKIPPIFALFKDNIINVLIYLSGKMAISLFSVQLTKLSGRIYPHHWVKTKKVMGLNLPRLTWVTFMLILGQEMRSASQEIYD